MYRTKKGIILASHSPRRRELLAVLGIVFDVVPADVDESMEDGERPTDHVVRLARAKAEAIAEKNRDAVVIGADTIVVMDGLILGKPRDEHDAARMLGILSGRTHKVMTGIAVIGPGSGNPFVEAVTTQVTMRRLDRREIAAYIATGEPMDKAGAYAVQGAASAFITGIDGSYTNVVGLPTAEVVGILLEMGALETARLPGDIS